ncbi:MAG: alanine--tRNA ligase-related protein, partial [Chloroflexi bacterium]|nr:alanine--tRNA ligase-related protein [Chloroflexota bacterium]
MNSNDIRNAYLNFFVEKKHKVIPSSSLIPHGDPTLLLTTAGMVQVKPYFLGIAVPPNPRLASCQKCFRTTDIDSVGDNKHLTFFEMLGNFSVGDYFKKEAIEWAWEFVIERMHLPPEKLWVTIYLDDDEAFNIWKGIGFPEARIVRLGDKDNFWGPAGDSGPCGPCSEIHYDFGEKYGCGKSDCGPDCSCGRFSEIWNLVFTEYNQAKDGSRTRLPKPNIDTGMGLERIVAAAMGNPTVYDTDLFSPLIQKICRIASVSQGKDESVDRSIKVIAEHSRGISFLLADGLMPSNEGRGYV